MNINIATAKIINPYQSKVPRGFCSFCGKEFSLLERKTNCSIVCTKRKNAMKRCKTSRFKLIDGYSKTQTGISIKWEKWFCDKFDATWVNEEIMGKPYDVIFKGKNIDIKVANLYTRNFKRGKIWHGGGTWSFKPNAFFKPEIDFFACICLKSNIPVKVLLIPPDIYYLRKGLSIGEKSSLDVFNIL